MPLSVASMRSKRWLVNITPAASPLVTAAWCCASCLNGLTFSGWCSKQMGYVASPGRYSNRCWSCIVTLSHLCAGSKEKQLKAEADEEHASSTILSPSLWKCYWTKMQSMLLLSGTFMLLGSLLHFTCPVMLYYIIQFIEDKNITSKADEKDAKPRVSYWWSCFVFYA